MRNHKRTDSDPRRYVVQLSSNHFSNFILNKMDWIKKNWAQTILVAFITVVFSTVGSVIVYSSTKKVDKINNSASTEYVDKKAGELKTYVDVQDNEIKVDVQRLEDTKADKDAVKTVQDQVNVIYQWVLKQDK